jgi:hypothetical protein
MLIVQIQVEQRYGSAQDVQRTVIGAAQLRIYQQLCSASGGECNGKINAYQLRCP